jgi:hypothetical protein
MMPVATLVNVANFDDLLEEIRDFLNATGDWTIHRDLTAPPSGEGVAAGGRELVVSNGVCLVGLRSTTTGAGANHMYMFDGIPPWSSSVIDTMPGNSGIRVNDLGYSSASAANTDRHTFPAFAGPFPTAFIFTDDPSTYCHVAVEVEAGKYRHINFGNMRKFGTWTGGAYYAMTDWSQSTNQIDVPNSATHATPFDSGGGSSIQTTFYYNDGVTTWRCATPATLNSVVRLTGAGSTRGGFGKVFRIPTETPFSGLVALAPITFWSTTVADTPDTVRCMGQIKDIATLNIANFEPGESYFIGSDEWIVFPMAAKHNPADRNDVENSGYYGIGYLVKP